MSGSSAWPMSAVYVHGTAPLSRIHATATEVSRPPEKAIPTRSPTGREARTLDTAEVCMTPHDHASADLRPAPGRHRDRDGPADVPQVDHEPRRHPERPQQH